MDPVDIISGSIGHDFLTLWVHESTWGVIKTTDCYTSVESWTQDWKKILSIGEIFFLFWVHESSWGTLFYTLCRILDPCFKIASPLGLPWHLIYNHGPWICISLWVHDSKLGLNFILCTILDPGFVFLCGSMIVHEIYHDTSCTILDPGFFISLWVHDSTLDLPWQVRLS